ncbi:hypothetical protein PSTT_05716 [Puccinia striiformis]|uniref:Uncharacterized protein n=1 Tax=Puccinia striiformis TaxID=27350 RepID=A0A2S4VN57_9BASI|nr:hypothetical protein PSTT_05716 [Puccinia striiformis]
MATTDWPFKLDVPRNTYTLMSRGFFGGRSFPHYWGKVLRSVNGLTGIWLHDDQGNGGNAQIINHVPGSISGTQENTSWVVCSRLWTPQEDTFMEQSLARIKGDNPGPAVDIPFANLCATLKYLTARQQLHMSHLLLFTRSEFESPSYQQLRLQALLLTRKRRQPSPTHNTLAVTQEQLAAVQNRAHMPDVPTSEAQHKKPVRRQAKQVKTQFTKPVKTESILAKSGSIAIVPCKKPAIPVRGTCLKPADLQKGATAVGWQPAPLNSDDWDWIEANLAASRAREAEQAAIFKRDRIEANLASSDTRKAC